MQYNFDQEIDRSATDAEKIEGMKCNWGRTDLLPLWIADMDFPTPHFVREAIISRMEHPILGYTAKMPCYYNSIIDWVKARYGMTVEQHQIEFVPGVMPGIGIALGCFTNPGDKVMIMPPVYTPFSKIIHLNNRQLVECPLKFVDGKYSMDIDLFKRLKDGVRAFILCNPHNPGGIIWTREELEQIADICAENNIIVFSDEIHADLALPPHRHVPFAMISDKARQNSITFMSPSKAFNMPGISASHAIIFNPTLLQRFKAKVEAGFIGAGHVFAFRAVQAAYTHGTEWLEQCLDYVNKNIDYVDSYLKTHIPEIKVIRPMASYLIWLNCRELGWSHEKVEEMFVEKARLALNSGVAFGEKDGYCCMRLNVGTPRSVLVKAMQQLKSAYEEMKQDM